MRIEVRPLLLAAVLFGVGFAVLTRMLPSARTWWPWTVLAVITLVVIGMTPALRYGQAVAAGAAILGGTFGAFLIGTAGLLGFVRDPAPEWVDSIIHGLFLGVCPLVVVFVVAVIVMRVRHGPTPTYRTGWWYLLITAVCITIVQTSWIMRIHGP